jgi:hypothetical protein
MICVVLRTESLAGRSYQDLLSFRSLQSADEMFRLLEMAYISPRPAADSYGSHLSWIGYFDSAQCAQDIFPVNPGEGI